MEQELHLVKLQLTEAQSSVSRLQNDLDQLLSDKVVALPTPYSPTKLSLKKQSARRCT